jgi:hypothetical protein
VSHYLFNKFYSSESIVSKLMDSTQNSVELTRNSAEIELDLWSQLEILVESVRLDIDSAESTHKKICERRDSNHAKPFEGALT